VKEEREESRTIQAITEKGEEKRVLIATPPASSPGGKIIPR